MSSVSPSSEVPVACMRARTRVSRSSRRFISARYGPTLGPDPPRGMMLRSAVATGCREPTPPRPPHRGAVATRAADESAEQARLLRSVDDALGVPLHAEDEGSIGVLDPLDHPVRRPRQMRGGV